VWQIARVHVLAERRAWVFDMDGTLTHAVHDFDAIRAALDIASGQPILEALAAMPAEQSAARYTRLDAIEADLADAARAAPGAEALLLALNERGARLGILTRNSRANALRTLAACGLERFFEPAEILGRDEAPPKPDPRGILTLGERWGLGSSELVMIGDYRYDLEAGRAAGAATIYVDVSGAFPFASLADVCVSELHALLR
jgi:HAD superfamily hydrolase (TIGR01509 family)